MTKLPPSLVRVRQEWQWIRTMPRRICPSLGRVEVAKPRSRFNASMPKLVRQIPRNLSSQYGPLPNPKYPPLKFAFPIVSPIGVYVIVPRQRHPNPLYSTPRILAPGFRRLQGFVVKACSDYERVRSAIATMGPSIRDMENTVLGAPDKAPLGTDRV